METDENFAELETSLYARIHHDISEIDEIKIDSSKVQCEHNEKTEEKAIEKCNPDSFVDTTERNSKNFIPSHFTPYISYLAQIDSKPFEIQIASVQEFEQKRKLKEANTIIISDSDSNDAVQLWVEEPAVISIDSSDEGKQRANRHSLKRSYKISETDFASTNVYEFEVNRERFGRIKERKSSKRKINSDNKTHKNHVDHETFENAGHGSVCYTPLKLNYTQPYSIKTILCYLFLVRRENKKSSSSSSV